MTDVKHKIAHKLFNTPTQMASLNWDHPDRKAARAQTLKNIVQSTILLASMVFVSIGESLLEIFFNFVGM